MKVKDHITLLDEYQKAQADEGYKGILRRAEDWANQVERLMEHRNSFEEAVDVAPAITTLDWLNVNLVLGYLIRVWEYGEQTQEVVVPRVAAMDYVPSMAEIKKFMRHSEDEYKPRGNPLKHY